MTCPGDNTRMPNPDDRAAMNAHAARPSGPSTDELRARLHSRLDQIDAERPDLGPALVLQRVLLTREIELLDALRAGGLPSLSLPPRYLAAKLAAGIPALHAEPIPLPTGLLTLSLRDFCERLRSGSTAAAVEGVVEAFDARGLDGVALLSACFGRDQQRVRLIAGHFGISPDLVWLVTELALAPFAHLLQGQVLSTASTGSGASAGGDAVCAALANWDRGFCPACGSWPTLIEAGADGHLLRCSFCARGWQLLNYRCIYCGNDAEGFITAAADPEQPGRRLQLCGACGGYVKVLEVAAPTVFPLVAIEDLVSLDLDMAAIQKNYVRPALPEIKKRQPGSGRGLTPLQ